MIWTARCRDGVMSCCWLWLFCAHPSFLVDGRLGCWSRRVSPSGLQRTGKGQSFLVSSWASRAVAAAPSFQTCFACVHMYFLYVCVYICVCVYVCRHIYIHICACVYVCVYVCVYTHVYVYVYANLCIDCESQYQSFSVWTV